MWLEQLVVYSPVAMTLRDPETDRWLWVSPALTAVTGRPRSAMIGARMHEVYPPRMARLIARLEQEALAQGRPRPLSGTFPRLDGRIGHFEGASFPVRVGGRTLAGTVCVEVTDRVAAQRHARLLLDHLPILLTAVTVDGVVLSVDGAGVPDDRPDDDRPDDGPPQRLDDLVPPGDPARDEVYRLHRAASAGELARGRFLWRGRWHEARSAPLTEDGETTGVLTVSLDVHDQVVTAEQARAAEARFDAFMRHCPAPAVIKDAEGRYVWANPAYLDCYGLEPDGWAGTRLADHVEAEVAARVEAADQRVLATGQTLYSTDTVTRRDGVDRVLTGFRFPLRTADGDRLLGEILLDVTDRTSYQEELSEWRDRHWALFDQSPAPMVVLDATSRILEVNPAFARMLGTSPLRLRGRYAADLACPEDGEVVTRAASAVFEGRATSAAYRRHYLRPDDRARVSAEVLLVRVPEPGTGGHSFVEVTRAQGDLVAGSGPRLGEREARVLELRALGASVGRIASEVGITSRGVDYHLNQLSRKLGVTTSGLVARAYHLGVLGTADWPPRVPAHHRRPPDA
jgi:PAS domain S-box-containing protein